MNKVFVVVRREFVERVRTKAFLIGTFLMPVFMVFMMVMPALMMTGGTRTQRIAIVDATTDGVGGRVESGLMAQTFTSDGDTLPRYDLTRVKWSMSPGFVRPTTGCSSRAPSISRAARAVNSSCARCNGLRV